MRQRWLSIAAGVSVASVAAMAITACAGEATPDFYEEADFGSTAQGLSCSNTDGVYSTMSAIAVAVAQELGRWQPSRDFAIAGSRNSEFLVLTSAAKARCSDGKCSLTQALLDFQLEAASGKVIFPGGVRLSSAGLRSRLTAKFREQQACESRPANGNTQNCPVEEHTLRFLRSERGGCDTNFYFQATGLNGQPLQFPAQLANKLKWADELNNPYINLQANGDVVSIDPTWQLNEEGTTTTGACTAACTKITRTSVAGQCCDCNGATGSFVRSAWNAVTYVCQ